MSNLKRKRSEDPLLLETIKVEPGLEQTNPSALWQLLERPVVLGPGADNENSQIVIMNNSNISGAGYLNTFLLLPHDGEGAGDAQTRPRSIPVYMLVRREQPPVVGNVSEPIKDEGPVGGENETDVSRSPVSVYLGEDPLQLELCETPPSADRTYDWKHRVLYKCDYIGCPKMFLCQHDRDVHRESHFFTGNAAYKCGICNMSFLKAIDRNKHVESHSVPSTHVCSYCKASFPYYTTLIQHLNNTCLSNCVKCQFCNISFASKEDARQHEIKLHVSYSKDKLTKVRKRFGPTKTLDADTVIVLD